MRQPTVLLPDDRRDDLRSVDAGLLSPRHVYGALGVLFAVVGGLLLAGTRGSVDTPDDALISLDRATGAAASRPVPATSTTVRLAVLPGTSTPLDGGITNVVTGPDGLPTARPGLVLTAPAPRTGWAREWRWQLCPIGDTCTDLPGATARTFTVPMAAAATRMRAVVTVQLAAGPPIDLATDPFVALPDGPTPEPPPLRPK